MELHPVARSLEPVSSILTREPKACNPQFTHQQSKDQAERYGLWWHRGYEQREYQLAERGGRSEDQ